MPNSSISTTYILKPNLQDAFWIGLFWFGAPLFPVHVYSVHWMLLLLPTLVHFSNFPFPHLRIGGLRVQGKGGSNHLQLPRGQETRHKGKWRKELGLSVKAKCHVTILVMRKIMMMMLMRAREWWRILIPGTASPRFPTGENHLPAAHPQQHKHFICQNKYWIKNILTEAAQPQQHKHFICQNKYFYWGIRLALLDPIRHLWKLCLEKNVNLE